MDSTESYKVEVWRRPNPLRSDIYRSSQERAEWSKPQWVPEGWPSSLEEATLKAIEMRELYVKVRIATTVTYYQEV